MSPRTLTSGHPAKENEVQPNRWLAWLAAGLTLVAIVRIAATYRNTAQGFDETCHVAAGIQLLAQEKYTLDPVHPPLSRIAIGLPLYLAGERYPTLRSDDADSNNYNVMGNAILYGDGHYLRNLILARIGVLPFFILATAVVFLWTRREFGAGAALMAVALFTTLPIVLAFSSLAYTDIGAASTQAAGMFAMATWLDNPTRKATLWLGVAGGLAFLAKLTSFLFVPAAAIILALAKWGLAHKQDASAHAAGTMWIRKLAIAASLAIFVVWAGYGFSFGHVQEDMRLSPASMPSFQHFPAPVGRIARQLVVRDAIVPAPAFLRGTADAWVLNKSSPHSYLLGRTKEGGWWYFFLVGLAVKTPIPVLLLSLIGLLGILATVSRERRWQPLAPALCVAAILVVTMPVKYNTGTRHVLAVFPLLAVVAGAGCSYLWTTSGPRLKFRRVALVALLAWQALCTARASKDYIAYFNEFAGRDPSRIMITGCDLDCGQDVFRLARELRKRNVSRVKLAMWSSADMAQMGLPSFEVLQPFQPVTGWIAISVRSLRLGHVFHQDYPEDAFAWLSKYEPVGEIGRTVRLYHIPEHDATARLETRK
jgi:4-amino-4-deoxy-L-arabinose transferase-like glycosyltransferase